MAEPEPAPPEPAPAAAPEQHAELAGIDPRALAPPVAGEPSSHESCGNDPAGEVRASWVPEPPPEPEP